MLPQERLDRVGDVLAGVGSFEQGVQRPTDRVGVRPRDVRQERSEIGGRIDPPSVLGRQRSDSPLFRRHGLHLRGCDVDRMRSSLPARTSSD
jgi:hypothetical protein